MTTDTTVPDSRLRNFRPDIEGFRGLAIAMVVIHHIGLPVFGGVDASFALSAYLATTILLREFDKPDAHLFNKKYVMRFYGRYYASRFRRLLPAASLVIGATLVGAWLFLPVLRLKEVGYDGLMSALPLMNIRLLWQSTDYFAEQSGSSPFMHFWSLAIEEQFYFVYPTLLLLLVLGAGRLFKRPRLVVGTVLVVGIVASLYLSVVVTQSSQPTAYFGPHTRAWELGIGALAGLLSPWFARMPQALAALVSWAGLGAMGIGSWVISQSSEEAIPGSIMLWPVVGTALFMAGGCANPRYGAEMLLGGDPSRLPKPLRGLAKFRAVQRLWQVPGFVGRVSYGWYLWHWPVLIIAPYALGFELSLAQNAIAALGAFGLAVVTYYGLQKRVVSRKELVDKPRRGIVYGGAWAVLAAWVAGVVVATTTAQAAPPRPVTTQASAATITQKIAAATKATRMSSIATSRLETVEGDLYPGCIVGKKETTAEYCNLGDANGDTQMVLLGSSLAWQWIPTVKAIAQERHSRLAVFSKAGCPAESYDTDSIEGDEAGEVYNECGPWRKDAYAKIAALQPDLVVLASRAEPQATPGAIRGAVEHFTELGAKVVLIRETPHMGFDVPECLRFNGGNLGECMINTPVRPQSEMAANAARDAGAVVIYPTPWLCAEGRCPTVVDDMIVYWDDHHITATYAIWLTGLVTKAMEPALPPIPTNN